ncbi:hypothetical protein [Streptomyces sp. NPDC002328]|uniref:hypothetical protein n=1 Tax=Streptomyces sp. NPDC002328 TaxID=3364642 RepID=UPI00367851EC
MPIHRAPTRHRRTRLLLTALACAAALALTACEDGQGVRDEGPSEPSSYGVGEAPARPHAEPPIGNS